MSTGEFDEEVNLPPDIVDEDSISLPSDVASETGMELPPSTNGNEGKCTCKRFCAQSIGIDVVTQMRQKYLAMAHQDKLDYAFDAVRQQINAASDAGSKKISWTVRGTNVCLSFWQHCHSLSPGKVQELRGFVHGGHLHHPERLPRAASRTSGKEWLVADSWFLSVYIDFAEHMAETIHDADGGVSALDTDLGEFDIIEINNHPLWMHSLLVPDPKDPQATLRYARKKHIQRMTFEDILHWHQAEVGANQAVSRSTLKRCWDERWSKFLLLKDHWGQGKRCRMCANIAEKRRTSVSAEDRAELAEMLTLHHDEIKADRNSSVRSNLCAEGDSKKINCLDGHGLTCKISIDGMDQAKYRCPRNLKSNADFEVCWRPQLHMVAAIFHGVVEAYFIMDPDVAKDSNMEATVICRTLDIGLGLLPPNSKLPHSLEIGADNTAREAKNQFFAQFNSYLVATDRFEASGVEYLKTCHSHNEVDQRFSEIGTSFKSAPVLESPECFKVWMQNHVRPVRGRALHVEVLDTVMDFTKWLAPLNVRYTGLAACHSDLVANHSWRFLKRRLLGNIGGFDDAVVESDVSNEHPEWQGMAPSDDDVILVLKESMASTHMSQHPLLVLPAEVAHALDPKDLVPIPRNDLGDTVRKEFRKTAKVVAEDPWNLFKAQQFLERLCDANENAEPLPHLALGALTYKMTPLAAVPTAYGTLNIRVPRQVHVSSVPPADMRKRLRIGSLANSMKLKKRPAAAIAAGPPTDRTCCVSFFYNIPGSLIHNCLTSFRGSLRITWVIFFCWTKEDSSGLLPFLLFVLFANMFLFFERTHDCNFKKH